MLHSHKKRLLGYKMGERHIAVQVKNKLVKKIKPKIHQSVINRMKSRGKRYQPKNLVKLGGKYHVVV